MVSFKLEKCSQPLSTSDIKAVEQELDVQLPEQLKKFYLAHNGGNIKNSVIPVKLGGLSELSYIRFIPMLYSGDFINEPSSCIPLRTVSEWESQKGTVPKELIPFAFASPGYLCISHLNEGIYFFNRWSKANAEPVKLFNSFQELLEAIEVIEPEPLVPVAKHVFWGEIVEDWAGFASAKAFFIPHFNKSVTIFLGNEYDEDGEDVEEIPTPEQLNSYATTFNQFMQNIDSVVADIKEQAFAYYNRRYANYYENSEKSGAEPLGISTPEKHFEAIKNLNYIRVLENNMLQILVFYGLDSEHGMEIKITANKVADIGGIAELDYA